MIVFKSLDKADVFSRPCLDELIAVNRLVESALYTEAGVRIGKACEAAVYSAAKSWEVGSSYRVVPLIESLRNDLRSVEVSIMKDLNIDAVKKISDTSRSITKLAIELTEHQNKRSGADSSSEKKTVFEMIKDLKAKIAPVDIGKARRLDQLSDDIKGIMTFRNTCAHANVDGKPVVVTREMIVEIAEFADRFLGSFFDITAKS